MSCSPKNETYVSAPAAKNGKLAAPNTIAWSKPKRMIGRKWARLSQRALLAESTRSSTVAKEITINPTCSKKASPKKKAILRRIKRTPRGDRKNVMIFIADSELSTRNQ
jgi:hypothetical protein